LIIIAKHKRPSFGEAARWFKRAGDPVTFREPLVEIDTDNATHEIRSPDRGRENASFSFCRLVAAP
jgi:hypothetical protein